MLHEQLKVKTIDECHNAISVPKHRPGIKNAKSSFQRQTFYFVLKIHK